MRRISANNVLPLENEGNVLKTPLPRCPTVFELLEKSLVLIYPSVRSVRPSISLFHPSDHDHPRKKCMQSYDLFLAFEQREHLISFAKVLLCLAFVYLFSAFILFIIMVIFMHPCFFFLRKIIHPSSHPFICRPSLYHLSVTCSSLL